MTATDADDRFMQQALGLAAGGLYTTDPNPRVGCVLVRDGRVIGEGWHARAGEPHAEVLALRSVDGPARAATAYVTLEPCSHTGRTPPCADALLAAGIGRVVCATSDPNPQVAGDGIDRLRRAGVAVTVGVCADQARELNPGFFSRFERGRPFIRLKLAMSLDARTTPADGRPRWITGEAARADVQAWRARSSVVLTGAGTVRVDDPRLDVRLTYGAWIRQPLRVVLDSDLGCPPGAKVFATPNALIFAAEGAGDARPNPASTPHAERIPVSRVPRAPRGLDLHAVVAALAAREANEVWVECGPRLAAGFLEAGLVDELILYMAPLLLGADAAPLAALSGMPDSGVLPQFMHRDQRMIGGDLRLILASKKKD